jgi:glutathione reductase (NADPH)
LNGIYQRNLGNSKVEVIEGFARFVDAKTVEVNGRKVSADNILIAVGGKPVYPEIPGAELISTSDDFFDWPHQPKKAVVVGAGYIAVELAGVLNALGTETSLVFRGEKVLRRSFDPLVQDLVNAELERTGVAMRRGTQLQAVAKRPDGKLDVALKDGSRVDGVDVVLFAAGRTPSFDGLGLERAGVAVSDKGYIVVDEFERTSVSGVHAIGDATTHNVELTPVAIAAGRRLSDRLFGGEPNARLEYESVPTVVFSHPPIGMVGLTEPDAVQRYGAASIKTYTSSFKPMHYAMCAPELKVPMAMKLVCTGPEEKVVGIHVCGIGADEMMQGFAVALRIGATKSDFDHCVALHPTAAEEFVTMFPWGQKDGKPYLPGTLRVS